MIARLLLLALLLLPVPAAAQPTLASTFLEGSWGLRLDGAVVMRFDLELTADGWAGAWVKPTSFRIDRSGKRFGDIVMPAVLRRADRGRAIGDWAEITFDDPRPGEEPDQFRFHLIGADRAELIYVGTGLPPYTLVRVATGAELGPFVEGKVYDEEPDAPRRPAPRPPAAAPPAPPPQGPPDDRQPAMIGR